MSHSLITETNGKETLPHGHVQPGHKKRAETRDLHAFDLASLKTLDASLEMIEQQIEATTESLAVTYREGDTGAESRVASALKQLGVIFLPQITEHHHLSAQVIEEFAAEIKAEFVTDFLTHGLDTAFVAFSSGSCCECCTEQEVWAEGHRQPWRCPRGHAIE